jgi:glycosyltransferase involved in cell wall biosynthesis
LKIILAANTDWFLYNYHLAHARFLREQGFEVVLVSPPGRFVPLLQEEGFRWLSWPVGRQSAGLISELNALNRLAGIYRGERPDLTHQFTIKPVLYGSLAARLAGVRRVVNTITGRGYIFLSNELRARLLRPGAQLFFRAAFARGCQVIFENEVDRAYFITNHLLRSQQAHLIPGVGADESRFTPIPEPPGPLVITFAGRLLWDKGIGLLVEACAMLRARGLEFRLVLAGEPDPGNPASIHEPPGRGGAARGEAEWWGFQSRIEEVYRQSHIVALPTFYGEGVPTVLIEAAACGLPVVASDLAGCRAVVEDGMSGLIVPLQNAPALADALEKLLRDPALRRRMGAAGRERFLRYFTHSIINRQTLEVYRRMMEAV